jgi:hypothetical protein
MLFTIITDGIYHYCKYHYLELLMIITNDRCNDYPNGIYHYCKYHYLVLLMIITNDHYQ